MKSLPTIAAVAIAIALVLSPFVANAAGSITFTSPTSGASYSGSQSYTISGTISPAPTQPDNVAITVTNPSGTVVDAGNPAVSSGAFSYATAVGSSVNPSSWPTGTYTISATDSFGATGSITFRYTSSTGPSFNETQALLTIEHNQALILGNLSKIQTEITNIQSTQASQGTTLSGLQSSLATLTSSVNSLQGSVSGLVTTVGSIQTTVNGLGSQVSNAATQATNAANAVGSTQTYVLVVAVLAAITLVLELAILVRKLS